MGVLPKIFYAAEIYPIPKKDLDTIRSRIARSTMT